MGRLSCTNCHSSAQKADWTDLQQYISLRSLAAIPRQLSRLASAAIPCQLSRLACNRSAHAACVLLQHRAIHARLMFDGLQRLRPHPQILQPLQVSGPAGAASVGGTPVLHAAARPGPCVCSRVQTGAPAEGFALHVPAAAVPQARVPHCMIFRDGIEGQAAPSPEAVAWAQLLPMGDMRLDEAALLAVSLGPDASLQYSPGSSAWPPQHFVPVVTLNALSACLPSYPGTHWYCACLKV